MRIKIPTSCRRPFSLLTKLCLFAIAAVVVCTPIAAQDSNVSVWRGVLRNAAGAPVSSATVKLTNNTNSGQSVTGTDGRFELAPLPAGQYRLTVETRESKAEFSQPIDLTPTAPTMAVTLSARGELTVSAIDTKQQGGTGGQELSSRR